MYGVFLEKLISAEKQTVSTVARSVGSSGTHSQHWTSAEGKLLLLPALFTLSSPAHILPALPFHPATFIIFSSLHQSSPPLSPAAFALYLSLALTSLQHCSAEKDISPFLPARCSIGWIYNWIPKALPFVHGHKKGFTKHLWSPKTAVHHIHYKKKKKIKSRNYCCFTYLGQQMHFSCFKCNALWVNIWLWLISKHTHLVWPIDFCFCANDANTSQCIWILLCYNNHIE